MGTQIRNSQKKAVYQQKAIRTFSKELKAKKVKDIELGLVRIRDVCLDLEVSKTSV